MTASRETPTTFEAQIETLVHTTDIVVSRLIAADNETIFYTASSAGAPTADWFRVLPEYLPGWAYLDDVQELDGFWYFTFTAPRI